MDIGLSTYTLPWAVGVEGCMPDEPLDIGGLLDICETHQVSRLQIGDNLPLHTLSEEDWLDIQTRANRAGIQLEVGTRRLEEAHIRQYLELARQVRSPFLRIVIDDGDYRPDEAEVIRLIRALLPEFRASHVRLGLENHDRFSAASLRRILESTSPVWVGVCLDTSNSLGAGEGLEHIVTVLGPYVLNLHYKDIRIQRVSHKMGFTVAGCCPGTGMIPLEYLVQELSPYGRCQSVTLEQWPPFTGDIAATIEQERVWAEEGIKLLKKYVHSNSQTA